MKVCSICHRCYHDSDYLCTDDSHPPLSETRSGSPNMIAGYRLDELLESGLRGDLYRAHQTACGQSCLIRALAADGGQAEKFLEEAQLTASLFHPSVVDVYEAGSLEDGRLFVVAEDPAGQTLRDLLRTSRVPQLLQSVRIMERTAEALHAIHLAGLVHGSLRPENIVLSSDPDGHLLVRIKDLDHGGVVQRSIVTNKFLIDSALDSLRYFAPEQFSASAATPKTDIYSLGVILYELLAGRPPFNAPKAAGLIEKHRNQMPAEIRIDDFNLRMLLTHSLMASLHKRPEMRQSSSNAFARQLRHIEQLSTHVSTPPPAGIVPPAPARTAAVVKVAAVTARSFVIPPAAELGSSWNVHDEISRPATAATQAAPIATAAVAVEPQPVSPLAVERKVITATPETRVELNEDMRLADEAQKLSTQPIQEAIVETPVIEKIASPVSARLSRLKMRRKTHAKIAPSVGTTENGHHPIIEANEPAQPEAAAVRIPPAEPKPEEIEVTFAQSGAANVVSDDHLSHTDVVEAQAWEWLRPPLAMQSSSVKTALKEIGSIRQERHVRSAAVIPEMSVEEPLPTIQVVQPEPKRSEVRVASLNNVSVTQPEPKKIEVPIAPSNCVSVAQPEPKRIETPVAQFSQATVVHAKPEKIESKPAINRPMKIEWNTPDDDIPSPADVLEALGEAPLPVARNVERPPKPADVIQFHETARTSAEAKHAETASAPATLNANKVVWDTPDDDIPSAADVLEALADEPLLEIPAMKAEPPRTDIPIVHAAPVRKVEWTLPDFDIPSAAEIFDELDNQPVLEIPVRVKPKAKPMQAEAGRPRIIVNEQPKAKAPAKTAVQQKPPAKRRPMVQPEPEEITLVTAAPRRIKVEWDKPVIRKSTRPDPVFIPTILGAKRSTKPVQIDRRESIISAYNNSEAVPPRYVIDYRSLAVGGGLIVLIGLFLFGNGSVAKYFNTSGSGDAVSAKSVAPKQTVVPIRDPNAGQKQKAQKPVTKDAEVATPPSPAPDPAPVPTAFKDTKIRPTPTVQTTTRDPVPAKGPAGSKAKGKLPNGSTVSENVRNTPSLQSTLVISSNNGKVNMRTEPAKNSSGNKGVFGPAKPDATTRPRFVKNGGPK